MAIPYVPWEYRASAIEVVHELRERNYQIVGVEQAHGSRMYTDAGIYRPPVCLIFGHERAGVTASALAQTDLCVEIPVYGMANSLNVAMACVLIGYELLRQHDGFKLNPL
jgi:tRNA G18 (ribose-2'-O)-methylase SpoU